MNADVRRTRFDAPSLATVRREIDAARRRLRGRVVETPTLQSERLSALIDATVFLKHEQLQRTGSFKFRGALNKVRALSSAARRRGIVAASTGNHGIAVATALREVGGTGTVFVPRGADGSKVRRLRALGVEVRTFGDDCVETEGHARAVAERTGRTFISPYNDLEVVAGQGTVGVELARQIPDLDAVVVAAGGGGLIAGIAAALKARSPSVRVIAAQPRNSAVLAASIAAGHRLDVASKATLSDATAGGIEDGAITLELGRRLIDDFVLVTEREIERSMRDLIEQERLLVEGAAAMAVAAAVKCRRTLRRTRVAVVLCGRNVAASHVRRVLGG